jgi:hypothetical protein
LPYQKQEQFVSHFVFEFLGQAIKPLGRKIESKEDRKKRKAAENNSEFSMD